MSDQPNNSPSQGDRVREYQFKPGESGNLKGRPKGNTLTNRLKAILEEEVNGKTVAQALMEVGVKSALKGDYRFWNHIAERIDGKMPIPHEHTGEDGGPLRIFIEDVAEATTKEGGEDGS